ncbi:dsDNA binding protein [Aeromonas phage AsFcp_4]|nr:dsDNA binding protein [Aeromonas phage AsFcp_2]QAX99594.1 dsDNA binding protein [Aeromonas phage AsFcp_4]
MTKEKKVKKAPVEFNVNAHSERLAELISEAEGHMTQIASYQEMIKEIKAVAKSELGVEGKEFSKMAKIYFKRERDQVEAENEDILEKYDAAFPRK